MSTSTCWRTPPELFATINDVFNFTLDAAASKENALCSSYYTEQDNALEQPWRGSVWLNPPYGRGIDRWLIKARNETASANADVVVALLPAHVDAGWFHDYVLGAASLFLFRGRVPFIDPTGAGRTQPRHGGVLAVYDDGCGDESRFPLMVENLETHGWRGAQI